MLTARAVAWATGALDTSWVSAVRIAGHQVWMVVASRVVSGMAASETSAQPPSDLGWLVPLEEQPQTFVLHTPGGADLPGWVLSSIEPNRLHCLVDSCSAPVSSNRQLTRPDPRRCRAG